MLRVRSEGALLETGTFAEEVYPVSCANRVFGPASTTTAFNVYLGEKRVTTDVVTPSFRKRMKKGELILNQFDSEYTKNYVSGSSSFFVTTTANACTGPNIKAIYRDTGALFTCNLRIYETPKLSILVSQGERTSLEDEAWTEALAGRRRGGTNLIESLAEAEQAFGLLANPLGNAITFIDRFRVSGRRRKAFKEVKANSRELIRFASSEYLRFRYGIQPIMSDIKAIMKALETGWNRPAVIHRSRGNARSTRQTNETSFITGGPVRMDYRRVRADQFSVKATCYDSYRMNAFDELGLTFHNVVGVPWELTRYSFVVDWFANVGDLIYANIPRVNTEFLGGVVSTRNDLTAVWSPTGYSNLNPASYVLSGSISDFLVYSSVVKRRIIRTDGGRLVIKGDFRLDNWKRASDAAALLLQRLISIRF